MPKATSARSPEGGRGIQYHIGCKRGDVAKYVLLPGDPERVPKISSSWSARREVSNHRGFVTHTGIYEGSRISCVSTGIGGPSAAIVLEELLRVGADTFIRVGTTAALNKGVDLGDITIATGSVRMDGTSAQYIWPGYPATASYEVVIALVQAAEDLGVRYHLGVAASTDSFYPGQARPGYLGYETSSSASLVEDARRARVLNFEMESSTIFTLCGLYGARAGAVCAVIANRETDQFRADAGVESAIAVANRAVKVLHDWDSIKAKSHKRNFYPSLLSHK